MSRSNLESALEHHFVRQLREQAGARTVKLAPTQAGVPDRLVMFAPGMMYLVELKTNKGELSEIQKFWHQQLAALGITVHVLYGKQQVDAWIGWAIREAYEHTEALEKVQKKRRQQELGEINAEKKGIRPTA